MQLPKFKAVETGVAVTVVDQCTKQPAAGRVVLEGGEELFLVEGKANRALTPGDYRGTLSAAGYPDRELTFAVEAGKTTALEIEWSASTSELTDKIPFAVGSAEITTSMEAGLDKVAAAIRRSCALKRVTIEGHTDDSENPGLGERRAQAVRDYLVGKGVDAALLSMEGLGATRPMASNAMAWGREQNRRVEFRVEE
jgi:outer membrane protein OmpA-like peptidoglycan-associated protein